jgi:hypothetical protein
MRSIPSLNASQANASKYRFSPSEYVTRATALRLSVTYRFRFPTRMEIQAIQA